MPVSAGWRVVLVPEAQLGALLARLRADSLLAARVVGVLALPSSQPTDPHTPGPRPAASLAARFPLAELAPYEPGAWVWNPVGAGLLRAALPAPVALLDDGAAADARRRAAANARQARWAALLRHAVLVSAGDSQPGILAFPCTCSLALRTPAVSCLHMPRAQQPSAGNAGKCACRAGRARSMWRSCARRWRRTATRASASRRARACHWARTACGPRCRRCWRTRTRTRVRCSWFWPALTATASSTSRSACGAPILARHSHTACQVLHHFAVLVRPTCTLLLTSQGPGVSRVQALGPQGAEAPLSGLVAMLAAAEALGNASAAGNYSRRLAFVALAGEPWGLMGSRRLLWQMHAGDPSVHGLRLDAVEQARPAATHVLGRMPGMHAELVLGSAEVTKLRVLLTWTLWAITLCKISSAGCDVQ